MLFGVLGDHQVTGQVVDSFGPVITINIKKCTDNPALGVTKTVKVPALVRRRGSCTKIAGGLLTGGTSGVYITCRKVRHFFPGRGVVLAKGPIQRKLASCTNNGSRTIGAFNLRPRGGAILLVNKDLNTQALGRDILKGLALVTSSNVRLV